MLVLMLLALFAAPLVLAGWFMAWYALDSDRRPFARSAIAVEMQVRRRR